MITTEITLDLGLVKEILTHDDIWWRISDTDNKDVPIPIDHLYLLARVDDVPAGVFIISPNGDSHVQYLPEYREIKYEISRELLKLAAEYVDRVTAEIPKDHPNVHYFALKNGYNVTSEDETSWHYERLLWAS